MKRTLGTKLYYSIGEVADLTQLQPHTLRAWEKEFSCLRPKRMGKNRAYRERDIGVILLIRQLLYQERYSTRGAQLRLKNEPELIRSAADNASAFLQGDRNLPAVQESEMPAATADGAQPAQRSGPDTTRPTQSLTSDMEDGLRQQVLAELRTLVNLLS